MDKLHKLALTMVSMLVIIGIAVWLFNREVDRRIQAQGNAIEQYRGEAKAAAARADSVQRVVAARQAEVDRLKGDVERLKNRRPGNVDSLRREVDSLYGELSDSIKWTYQVIPKQQTLIGKLDSTVVVLDSVVAKQSKVIVLQDTSIKDLRTLTDSLRLVLFKAPPATRPPQQPPKQGRDKLLGLIPMPTRMESFVGGVLVAGIGAVVVTK